MIPDTFSPTRCGIVLAGGNGNRLQPYIRRTRGSDLPKQYVNLIGTRSMLEHTYGRVEQLLSPEQIFTVVARDHLAHVEARKQIGKRPSRTVIFQPANRDTGPGLLLPLIHLYKHYPNSTVAVFPSDHFVLQEDRFMSYVRQAYEEVEKSPAKIVFLAVPPTDLELEYGYILPDLHESDMASPVMAVKTFVEKPELRMASQIITLGALWNTMVMVFKPEILLHLVSLSAPALYRAFQKIFRVLDTHGESLALEKIYSSMTPVNLSKNLLESIDLHSQRQLSVISMKDVYWSDWGSEERIISAINNLNCMDHLQRPSFSEIVLHPFSAITEERMAAGL